MDSFELIDIQAAHKTAESILTKICLGLAEKYDREMTMAILSVGSPVNLERIEQEKTALFEVEREIEKLRSDYLRALTEIATSVIG